MRKAWWKMFIRSCSELNSEYKGKKL